MALPEDKNDSFIVFVDMEIIVPSVSHSRFLCALAAFSIGLAPGLLAGDVVLHKVPPLSVSQTPDYPENLARHLLGATVQNLDASSGTESILLSGDPTTSYPLPLGPTTLLVSLPQIENVGSVALLSQGAKGSISIATSSAKMPADSPQWRNAFERELSAEAIAAKIGPIEAKYVRLTFNVTEAGRIAGLGVYSTPQVSDFTAARKSRPVKDEAVGGFGFVAYNYTDLHARARALYVSSGADLQQANNMIDDQTATSYSFAADDGSPTTVIDLGEARPLRRLAVVYSPRAGKMAFYVLSTFPGRKQQAPATATGADSLPPSEVASESVTLDDAALSAMKIVGTATDDGTQGRASIDFPETTGRYVMVRWTPASRQDGSFTFAEVAALGSADHRLLTLAANSEGGDRWSRDNKTVPDGKTTFEAKDIPAEGPPEAPTPGLPQPPPV